MVENYLKNLDDENKRNVILSHLQSPRTASLAKDKPVCTAYYTCDEEEKKCTFGSAKTAIRENVDLKAYSGTSVALALVDAIERNAEDFLPHKYDGFQLYRGGFDLVLLKRKGADDTGRTGFIEYNDLRANALEQASRDRQKAIEHAVVKVADNMIARIDRPNSCSVM